jgi:signal peptidase I
MPKVTMPNREDINRFWQYIKEPLLAFGFVLVATTAIARPYYIPSGSMEPTLQIGDDVVTAKYAYGYSRYSLPFALGPSSDHRLMERLPARGDIAVFIPPSEPGRNLIKRVIGLPGDRIQMINGRLWINGQQLPTQPDGTAQMQNADGSYMAVPKFIETLPNGVKHAILKWRDNGFMDNTAVYVVPKDHLFMMGDNRDNSLDSRVAVADGGIGFIPVENLVGRSEVILGSVDYLNASGVWAWPAELRVARFFKSVR